MDFSFLKKQFDFQDATMDLEEMRRRLLDVVLYSSAVFLTGFYLASMEPVISNKLYPLAAFYTLFYLWLLVITLVKKLSYQVRTNSWLFYLYSLGLINLLLGGFNVNAGLFLLAYIAMCTLLYSLRAGVRGLLLSLASIGVMSYLIVYEEFTMRLRFPQQDLTLWVLGGIVFLLMGVLLAVSLTTLLSGLSLNLARVTGLVEELRQKNEALLESEARYRRLVETSPDAILLVGLDGKIKMGNLASLVLLGFPSAEEIVGWDINDLVPGDISGSGRNLETMLAAGVIRDVEVEMLGKDGRHIMVEFSASVVTSRDGKPYAILGVGRDITRRKIEEWILRKAKNKLEQRTEQLQASQVELRKLAGQVITIHEEERRIISQELHDDTGQALVTLKHSLSSALEDLPREAEALRDRLGGALKLVDRTMGQIRSVSHRLRPPALEVGGLNLSLMELCRECREQAQLDISYQGVELPGLPEEIAISLYRIAQEGIANTLKHAAATMMEVALGYNRNKIVLSIFDNGTGSRRNTASNEGIGLLGMQERLHLLGGELNVEANPERGYRLTALVPWKAARKSGL